MVSITKSRNSSKIIQIPNKSWYCRISDHIFRKIKCLVPGDAIIFVWKLTFFNLNGSCTLFSRTGKTKNSIHYFIRPEMSGTHLLWNKLNFGHITFKIQFLE